jgi:hypothetical protein
MFKSVATAATFWLAPLKVGHPPPSPLTADGGSHSLGLSSGGGEVHHQEPLHLEPRVVLGWLLQLGYSDRLLADELTSLLHCLMPGVSLLSAGSCSLPFLKGVPSLSREPSVVDCHHGLRGQSVL